MFSVDILGILITIFLMDIYNWKKVLVSAFSLNLATLLFALFFNIEFNTFIISGIFSYMETNGGMNWLINLSPFFIALIMAKSTHRGDIDLRLLIPWHFINTWSAVFFKLGIYNLLFQIIKIMLRG